jgi:hypothetical protein
MVVHQRVVKKWDCGTDSCNKLTVFDWLSNMSLPTGQAPLTVSRFVSRTVEKNFTAILKNWLWAWEIVATVASQVMILDYYFDRELVKIQMKKKGVSLIVKKFQSIEKHLKRHWYLVCRTGERRTNESSCSWIESPKLEMKISDIEFQGDGSKANYTANDGSISDFWKDFAKEFSTRVEMKLGFRQEPLVGGIGSCGREMLLYLVDGF